MPKKDQENRQLSPLTMEQAQTDLRKRLTFLLDSSHSVSTAYPNDRAEGTSVEQTFVRLRFPQEDHKDGIVVYTEQNDTADPLTQYHRRETSLRVVLVDTVNHTATNGTFDPPLGFRGSIKKKPIRNWSEWENGSKVDFYPQPSSLLEEDLDQTLISDPSKIREVTHALGRARPDSALTGESLERFLKERPTASKVISSGLGERRRLPPTQISD